MDDDIRFSVEDTQWHRVTFYDRLAEIAVEYVQKSDPLPARLPQVRQQQPSGFEKNTDDYSATVCAPQKPSK